MVFAYDSEIIRKFQKFPFKKCLLIFSLFLPFFFKEKYAVFKNIYSSKLKFMRKVLLTLTTILSLSFFLPLSAQQLNMKKLSDLKPRSIGPAGMSGRVTAIDVNQKNPSIIFVGTASGGLWRSVDKGISWKPVFDKQNNLSIGAVAIDQSNPDIIWVGTGEGQPRNSVSSGKGVFRSLDGGNTWQFMGLGDTKNISNIIISPVNSNVVYIGVLGFPWGPQTDRGLYKTTDGGKTWKKILYVNDLTGVADMVIDPTNPQKFFVAMWQSQRWPWFFESGGPGSGLYVTYDGGDSFKKLTAKDGMPEGELGRIGLAVSASNHQRVYALIESKKNALYRSDDGGRTWKLTATKNIGGRPFYFGHLYVDPKNENNVYTLFTWVNKSEDGGKTFFPLIRNNIHPDNHAWWISPTNPNFMIDGNDGGLAITYDQGKTWRYVQNLPVGQFYHIRVDNDLPYHVYGGMQDNGSWRGPAYVWARGGIINSYWKNLFGGDGFDVLPDRSNNQFCYAMAQEGYVARVNFNTGFTKNIRPVAPLGKKLRFNWNAAIAGDPFDPNTIYFGSQFLNKSTDNGNSWTLISPDLTTNDTAQQHQLQSGGLTLDATGAENYNTIITIAPSPLKKGLIWVGTDDGNVQLTTDGGKHWKNCIKDLPKGSWISKIRASRYNPGEAFVVANNYRQNDFKPYLFYTTNYGKTWKRLVGPGQVQGYCLSFVQDPVEPKLMFLGTENGLYFSIDEGKNWIHWTNGYPSGVSTMSLAIQPREGDLVIGTFGRSIYILDDIRPLRELATKGTGILDKPIVAFPPPIAYEVSRQGEPGVFAGGASYYHGENKPLGAMITFSVKEGDSLASKINQSRGREFRRPSNNKTGKLWAKAKKVTIKVIDSKGDVVRTLTRVPKTGVNRFSWSLDRKGYRFPGSPKPKPDSPEMGNGGYVLPGTYKLVFDYQGNSDSTSLTVKSDPRMEISKQAMAENYSMVQPVLKKIGILAEAMDRIKASQHIMKQVKAMLPKTKTEEVKNLLKISKTVTDSLKAISADLFPKKDIQGLYSNPYLVPNELQRMHSVIYEREPLDGTEKLILKHSEAITEKTIKRIQNFFDTQWSAYKKAAEAAKISPFKTYKPLGL